MNGQVERAEGFRATWSGEEGRGVGPCRPFEHVERLQHNHALVLREVAESDSVLSDIPLFR